jgi:membrane associated rhomboid family serine protease
MSTMSSDPRVTVAIVIACVALFLASGNFTIAGSSPGNQFYRDLELFGPSISIGHDYWRLVTGGFLHANLIHIGFNMYLLWLLGNLLEPSMGSPRFAALYFTALLWGSFGALVVNPNVPTVGASGAVFGLMGAAAVELRSRGINPFKTDIGALIIFNLVLSFAITNISVGGHIGGLIGGVLVGVAFDIADRQRMRSLAYVACLVLSAIAVVGALAAA